MSETTIPDGYSLEILGVVTKGPGGKLMHTERGQVWTGMSYQQLMDLQQSLLEAMITGPIALGRKSGKK